MQGGLNMDIASLSTAISQQNLLTQVSVAVLDKTLETVSDSSQSLTKMMEQSVQPELGQNIDICI